MTYVHTPTRTEVWAFVGLRAYQGLFAGLQLPCLFQILTRWSTKHDAAFLLALSFSGLSIAACANFPMASALCFTGVDGGWPLVFYVPGN